MKLRKTLISQYFVEPVRRDLSATEVDAFFLGGYSIALYHGQ